MPLLRWTLLNRRRLRLIRVALGGVLVMALAGCPSAKHAQVVTLIEAGEVPQAKLLLEELLAKRPTDRALNALLGDAVRAEVERLQEARRYDAALEAIGSAEAAYPQLSIYDRLRRDTRLAKVRAEFGQYVGGVRVDGFHALCEDFPADDQLIFEHAHTHATHAQGSPRMAMVRYLDLLSHTPDPWRTDERVVTYLTESLARYPSDHLQAVVTDHLYEAVKPYLLAHLYDPGLDARVLRRNAYRIVVAAGDDAEIDRLRFFTAELLYRTHLDSHLEVELRAYFDEVLAEGPTEALRAQLPETIDEAPILSERGRLSPWVLPIVEALYAEPLRPLLEQMVVSEDEDDFRELAHQLLQGKGWLDEELERRYLEVTVAEAAAVPQWGAEPITVASAARVGTTRGLQVEVATGDTEWVGLYDRMVALVVGIDHYDDPRRDLTYPVRDARAVAAVLRDRFAFDSVIELYDEDASRAAILTTLEGLTDVGENDALLIFWAGHGLTVTTATGEPRGYLMPHDGSMEQGKRYSSNISMVELRDTVMTAVPAKHKLMVVDACYGGILATRDASIPPPPDAAYLRSITRDPVFQILTAGKADQTVLDGGPGGHSVFAGHFITQLERAEGFVTASSLGAEVSQRVFDDARARSHVQVPDFGRIAGSGDFVFLPRAAE